MLKILVKKQLGEIFRSYTYDAKKNRARSKAATVGFFVFFAVIMWVCWAACSPSCPCSCVPPWPMRALPGSTLPS